MFNWLEPNNRIFKIPTVTRNIREVISSQMDFGFDYLNEALTNIINHRLNKHLGTKFSVNTKKFNKAFLDNDQTAGKIATRYYEPIPFAKLKLNGNPKAHYDLKRNVVYYGWKQGKVHVQTDDCKLPFNQRVFFVESIRDDGSLLLVADDRDSLEIHPKFYILSECECGDSITYDRDVDMATCSSPSCYFELVTLLNEYMFPTKEHKASIVKGKLVIVDPLLGKLEYENIGGYPRDLLEYILAVCYGGNSNPDFLKKIRGSLVNKSLFYPTHRETTRTINICMQSETEHGDRELWGGDIVMTKSNPTTKDFKEICSNYVFENLYVRGDSKLFDELSKLKMNDNIDDLYINLTYVPKSTMEHIFGK